MDGEKIPGAHDDPSVNQTQRQEADAAPGPKLPEKVEAAINEWHGTLLQSIGPKVDTIAYNEIHESKSSLMRQVAAALT